MGPVGIGIAVAVSAASAGYGVYASERARSESARQYAEAKAGAERQQKQEQAQLTQDKLEMQALADKQKAEQTSTEARLRQEQTDSLAKVRGEVPGLQAKLGEDLLAQQEHAYARMAPQLEARLNALGLLNSGALPEAQAKYQGDLEAQRQAALADFGASANRELAIDRPLALSSEDVGRQYEGMRNNLDAAKSNLAQTFANQNVYNQNQAAREQYLAGLGAANNSAAQSSANAYLNFGGQIGSGLINAYASKPKTQNSSLDALYKARGGWSSNPGVYQYA